MKNDRILLGTADTQILRRWREAVQGLGRLEVAAPLQELQRRLGEGGGGLCLVDALLSPQQRPGFFLDLVAAHPDVAFLFMTDRPGVEEGWAVIRAGARGYCNRYMAPELLRRVVELVASGEIWVGRQLLARLLAGTPPEIPASASEGDARLTPREREIAALISQGASNKQVARRLQISERTVKAHLSAIFRKTGVRDRLGLALYYRERHPLAVSASGSQGEVI